MRQHDHSATTATSAPVGTLTGTPASGLPGVEPKPAGAADLQSIFVSPRVVDKVAFDEYAGLLKKLVAEASTLRDLLSTATRDAKAGEVAARDSGKQLQTRAEQAARALPMLDQRLAKAEQLLGLPVELLAGEKAKAVERARAELDTQLSAMVTDRVTHFREQFESALRQRMDQMAREAMTDAGGPIVARAEAATAGLEQTVTEAEARVSTLVNLAHTQSESAARARVKQVEDLEKRLAARIAEVEAELAKRTESVGAVASALDAQIEKARGQTDLAGSLKDGSLVTTLDRFVKARNELGDLGKFESMVTKAEDLAQSAVFATSQLEAIKQQADHARSALGKELLEGAAKIDSIESRLTQLLAAAQQAGGRIADAEARLEAQMNALETRVQSAKQTLERGLADATAPASETAGGAHADEQIVRLAEQTRAMGQWLGQIMHQAHDCGMALDRVMRDADALAARLESLARRPGA